MLTVLISIVPRKAKEYAFYTFLEKQASHSKLDNICYTELNLKDYLENMSANEAQTVFSFRTRMADFKENYRGPGGIFLMGMHGMAFHSCRNGMLIPFGMVHFITAGMEWMLFILAGMEWAIPFLQEWNE